MRSKLLAALFVAPIVAMAATSSALAEEDCRLTLAASLPMTAGNINRIVVPAKLGNKPLELAIDTGSGYSGLTRRTVERLGLETHAITGKLRPYFPFAGGRVKEFVRAADFNLGDMTAPSVQLMVLPDTIEDVDGLMGADFVRQFDVEFDFAGGKVNMFKPHPCPGKVVYWTQSAPVAVIPFHTEQYDSDIQIDMMIDGKSVPTVVDTGAPNTSIGLDAASSWFGIDENTPGVKPLGNGYYSYHFKTLALEGVSLQNPEIKLRRSVSAHHVNYQGMLGINVLRQLRVYIAYKERKLYITSASAN